MKRIAFEGLALRRITAEVAAANDPTKRMLFSLGYVQEGLRRQHYEHPSGGFEDMVIL